MKFMQFYVGGAMVFLAAVKAASALNWMQIKPNSISGPAKGVGGVYRFRRGRHSREVSKP